jgi:hypothetical protein
VEELMQFDGISNFAANVSISANGILVGQTATVPPTTYTGTYSVSSNCVGKATISNGSGTGTLIFSAYGATKTAISGMYVSFALAPVLATGSANAIYGQPTSTPASETSAAFDQNGIAPQQTQDAKAGNEQLSLALHRTLPLRRACRGARLHRRPL